MWESGTFFIEGIQGLATPWTARSSDQRSDWQGRFDSSGVHKCGVKSACSKTTKVTRLPTIQRLHIALHVATARQKPASRTFTLKPRLRMQEKLLKCHYCPKGDNLWTPEAFTYSGSAYSRVRRTRKRMCNDCWTQRYVRVNGSCAKCQRAIRTWRTPEAADRPLEHKPASKQCRPRKDREKRTPKWAHLHPAFAEDHAQNLSGYRIARKHGVPQEYVRTFILKLKQAA